MKLGLPTCPKEDLDEFFEGVVGAVEANSFESQMLWEENRDRFIRVDGDVVADWNGVPYQFDNQYGMSGAQQFMERESKRNSVTATMRWTVHQKPN